VCGRHIPAVEFVKRWSVNHQVRKQTSGRVGGWEEERYLGVKSYNHLLKILTMLHLYQQYTIAHFGGVLRVQDIWPVVSNLLTLLKPLCALGFDCCQ